jgi:hypothetical protein
VSLREDHEVELITYLAVLWKWKWLVVGGTVAVAAAAFLISAHRPRTYTSAVRLIVTQPRVPGPDRRTVDATLRLKALADILRGESVAAEIIQRFKLDKAPHAVTVSRFRRDVVAVRWSEDTGVITIAATVADPQLAADTANAVAEKAIALNAGMDRDDALPVREYYRRQADRARQALDAAQAALRAFTHAAEVERLRTERRVLTEERVRLVTRDAEIGIQQAGLRTRARMLTEAIKDQGPVLTLKKSITDDPSLLGTVQGSGSASLTPVAALRMQTEEINPTYHGIRKDLIEAEASLASLEHERAEVERRLATNRARLDDIERRVGVAESTLATLARRHAQAEEWYQVWRSCGMLRPRSGIKSGAGRAMRLTSGTPLGCPN